MLDPEAKAIIEALALVPHPEGGFFRETFRSALEVRCGERVRAAGTSIYYLLPAGDFSALHRVASDEVWHYYGGDPLDLHTVDASGRHQRVRLGCDVLGGQVPQYVVPAGVWQAAVPAGRRYVLCGCTVAPGFSFDDFEMPTRRALAAVFPGLGPLIAQLTREEP